MKRASLLVLLSVMSCLIILAGCGVVTGAGPAGPTLPAGQPVVYARELYMMQGIENSLYIYADGAVLYITGTGLRFPSADHPAVRTWHRVNLSPAELSGLLDYFRRIDVNNLVVPPFWDGTGTHLVPSSDLMYTVSVASGDLRRELDVAEYFPPTRTDQTAIFPTPLPDIYNRLAAIAAAAVAFHTETITK
jgi:hypothetical protein